MGEVFMRQFFSFDSFSRQPYCFISYSSVDIERINPFVYYLMGHNVNIWIDSDIPKASNWSKEIADHIEGCSLFTVFVSANTFDNFDSYVYKEYQMAKHFNKPILFVLLDDINPDSLPNEWLPWWYEIIRTQCLHAYKLEEEELYSGLLSSASLYTRPRASYIVLENYSSSALETSPAGYWLIRLLVIVIKCSDGRRYIPLQFPTYGGIWTTPHIAYEFQKPRIKRLNNVSLILKYYDEWVQKYSDILVALEDHQYYQMGMFDNVSEHFTSYTEYKVSPNQQDRFKCYRVEEYHITSIDETELINIYDPERLHGYRYFPIDANGDADRHSKYVSIKDDSILFFGKKLSTNIANLLGSNNRFLDCTYTLPDNIRINEFGYIDNKTNKKSS